MAKHGKEIKRLPQPPHGSNAASREWSLGPHEPYWRTNSSYSPPPSRWDFRFQSEALSFGSHDGVQLFGSSASSNSRESRSWLRGNQLANHQYVANDGGGPYYSSPSDVSPVRQWTPPAIQEINIDDFHASSRILRPLPFSPAMEGTSAARDSRGSTSSRSDSSDYDSIAKSHHTHRNFSSRRCFMSKPVHPLSFPSDTPRGEATQSNSAGFLEFDAGTPRREKNRLSSASGSVDLTDVSEPLEVDCSNKARNQSDSFRCGLCERLLSQRSPWSSRRIVRSGDMPVAGVLSCRHVFHAECLDQTTPKAHKSDPPCPICAKIEEENSPEQKVFAKFFPRLRPFCEDGTSSKPWGCAQAGDCVEGALHTPSRSTMLSLTRSRIKKNLSMKCNLGKEFPGKARKSTSFGSQMCIGSVDHGAAGSSKAAGSSSK
ncbi:OLC1v1032755C1 [Oldenlandia corymbosa var. corymbosa]|uniref:OLC1v1032755C1 n=1 Tax=Oldenlandia corymbosa var. corymbosa TaxID=529605 RepID=A0AAV1CLK3_OLDCO|nr:OLC1v1032755C1 [Oldenlandia corymbosa var. corymbosa]